MNIKSHARTHTLHTTHTECTRICVRRTGLSRPSPFCNDLHSPPGRRPHTAGPRGSRHSSATRRALAAGLAHRVASAHPGASAPPGRVLPTGRVGPGVRRTPPWAPNEHLSPHCCLPVSLCQHGWLGRGPHPGPSRCGASASARRRAGPVSPPGLSAPQAPLSLAPGVISSPQAAGCKSLGRGAHVCWPALVPAPFPEARTSVLDRHPGRHSGGVPTSKGGMRT